jgi:hypothetical protein
MMEFQHIFLFSQSHVLFSNVEERQMTILLFILWPIVYIINFYASFHVHKVISLFFNNTLLGSHQLIFCR